MPDLQKVFSDQTVPMRVSVLFVVITAGVISTGVFLGAAFYLYDQSSHSIKVITAEVAAAQLNNMAVHIRGIFEEIEKRAEVMSGIALTSPQDSSFWTGPFSQVIREMLYQEQALGHLGLFMVSCDKGLNDMWASQTMFGHLLLHGTGKGNTSYLEPTMQFEFANRAGDILMPIMSTRFPGREEGWDGPYAGFGDLGWARGMAYTKHAKDEWRIRNMPDNVAAIDRWMFDRSTFLFDRSIDPPPTCTKAPTYPSQVNLLTPSGP